MKLHLAIAALMFVLVTHAEAQEEPTIDEQFSSFQTKLKEFGDDLTEKTRSVLKTLDDSEIASKTRSWLTEHFGKLRQKIDESFTKPE